MNRYSMPWIVRGDIDGFFGLAVDNLVQLLLIDALCRGVLGLPSRARLRPVLPGAAISILVGNLAYALAGRAAGGADRPHRRVRAALRHQHGVALRARVPRHAAGEGAGRAPGRPIPARVAWQAGLFATFASGLIELACAPSSPSGSARRRRARRCSRRSPASPWASSRSAFFSARSRIRIVGLTTLAVVMLTYFGRVRFKGRIPGGVVAVALGTLLCVADGHRAGRRAPAAAAALQLACPGLRRSRRRA